jgi:uncharacterized protein with PQ loop repeat
MEIENPHIFGLLATGILIATLGAQTVKQWREHTTRGIARWFFLGQVSASVCFIVYSILIGSTLFAVANALILLSALAGYIVLRINRKRLLRAPFDAHGRAVVHRPPDAHARVAVF